MPQEKWPCGGDHRSHRRPNAKMYIWHGRDVMMNEGQAGNIGQLLLGIFIDLVGLDFDRRSLVGQNLLDRH
ncbi:hypothetical protein SAMN05216315_13713 [Nitrosospira sp. Nsp18]|nr:hypothetical protein SAMN05216315_13713 [Nitrosospira sp. Nsp18]